MLWQDGHQSGQGASGQQEEGAISSLTKTAGYLAASIWAAIAVMQAYWALGGTWGVRTVLGEGNPIPPPLVLWIAVIVPLGAALIILGRMGVWGGGLPWGIFRWGTWAITALLVVVSMLNFAGGSSAEVLLGLLVLLFAGLCAIVAVSAPRSRGRRAAS